MTKKYKNLFIISTITLFAAFVVLKFIYYSTENTEFNIVSQISFSLLEIPVLLFIFYKLLKKSFQNNMKKFLIASSVGLALSCCFQIARIIIYGDLNGVLLFPVSLPIIIWACIYYISDSVDNKKGKTVSFVIAIPFLIFSLYFEIYSLFNL